MKLYVRYLLVPYAGSLLLLGVLLTGIYALVEFFDKLDNVTRAGASPRVLVEFLLFRLPQMAFDLWPVIVGLGGLLALAYLSRGGELLALRTLGFSPLRLSLPYLALGTLLSLLFTAAANLVLPGATYRALYTWEVRVKGKEPRGLVASGRLFFRGVDSFFTGYVLRPDASRLRDVTYARVDEEGLPRLIVWARRARFEAGRWVFEEGLLEQAEDGFRPRWFAREALRLEFSPETVLVVKRTPRAQSLRELWHQREFLRRAELPTLAPESEIACRLFYPLAGPVLLLWSLPLLLGQRGRHSLGRGLTLGVLGTAAGFTLVLLGKGLGDAGVVSPLTALPLALLLTALAGAALFRRMRY